MAATAPALLAESVLAFLNGGDAAALTSLCTPAVVVFAPIAEETIDPFAKRDPSKLAEFAAAFRRAFPDIRFALADVQGDAASVTVGWTANGTHTAALGYIAPSGRRIALSGSCLLKLAGDRIGEIRLAADVYDLLLQTGALCADPGAAHDGAVATNRAALAALRDAVEGRRTEVAAPLDEATVVHANVRFYASDAFDQIGFDFDGARQWGALLACLRDHFASVELRLDDGLSQGHTTTFRGRARVERDGEPYSYLFRVGFRARGARTDECWLELYVPPTLGEVFA